ncbi:hypothetical protein H6758_05245 [Candidatus Nomurabacteria bacterium]|nr:hypothetical protein [Candidatus Nomurabacteria bacterium]
MVSTPYSAQEVHSALDAVGVLMLVALFASLLVPFAAFSKREKLNMFFLQYAPLTAFGGYAVLVYHTPTMPHILFMLAAMGMHLGYWMSGIHSRAYRLEQWKLAGYDTRYRHCSRCIAHLNATGRSDLADELLVLAMSRQVPAGSLLVELRKLHFFVEAELQGEIIARDIDSTHT